MKLVRLVLAICLLCARAADAHDGLDLPAPVAVPEAWNIITLCQANLEKLIKERQWQEVPVQVFLSGMAIRFLQQNLSPNANDVARNELAQWLASAEAMARASSVADGPAIETAHAIYTAHLQRAVLASDRKIVEAPIFSCPMCKGIRELNAETRCFKCGMKLAARIIPATGTPGEPSIVLEPMLSRPLADGQPSEVRIRFSWKRDGRPVLPDDLLVVHTERIHLLIIDESLDDYHHEHPVVTETPGEYAFRFTPRRPGSYRVFADVTPSVSAAQEYPTCDLPGSAPGGKIMNRVDTVESAADGFKFRLRWLTGGTEVKSRRPATAIISVSDASGQPFHGLEPVMGAYAHIVGFYDDRRTVVHIHPMDAEPKQPADRGGPSFMFRFYAPRPGFIRLYAQVQIGGVSRFAPFGLNVVREGPVQSAPPAAPLR